jgi:nucleotidyltransferase AbiEii toxin of type IV toxin-antitoxin system
VLHPADAVANKLCALYGRAEVRDYIDVHGVLQAGRYAPEDLLRLAADHDPGFDPAQFAVALRAVRRFPSSAFDPYRLTLDQIESCASSC